MAAYLNEEQNLAELISQIPAPERAAFSAMKSNRIEAAFNGRYLVLFKPTGLNRDRSHRAPEVLSYAKFSAFYCDDIGGADVQVFDSMTNESMTVGHVPRRLFDYDVFVHIPPVFRLRWDARDTDDGICRSLVFPVGVFTKNRSNFYSAGVTYAETPNRFKELYPNSKIDLRNP